MIFGEGLETAGKPVEDNTNKEPVDLRTKKEGEGEGENAKTEEEKAAEAAETERNARKEKALAEGKTEEEFEAEEKAASDKKAEEEKNAGKTPEQIAAEKKAEEAKAQEESLNKIRLEERQKFLREMGVETEEELRAKLNPRKPKTPEELAAEEQIYNVSLAKYAVENKVFSNEEWLAVQNMRKAPDADLVFHNFSAEYKEANKGRMIDNQPDPVTDEEIKDKFNELYHIDSENKALKEQGEKNLALKAKSIREPLENKLEDIKAIYDDEMAQKAAVPSFKKFMQGIIGESIKDVMEYGENDDKVNVDLSKLDKEDIERTLVAEIGNREFQDFFKGKGTPEQRARIQKEITKEILYRTHKDIADTAFKAGVSKGTKTAAPGANARFVEEDKRKHQQASVTVTPEDNAKVAQAFSLS